MKTNPKQITRYIFALPIVSLVLISIVMILSFILFFINFKTQGISEFKQVIISFQKEKTHDIVDSVVYEIDERIRDLNRDMKNYLKEKVYDATSIIERVIKENQKKSREELIRIVSQIIGSIRFDNANGYYYIYDFSTNIIYAHAIKSFVGKDMTNFVDLKGQNLVNLNKKLIEQGGEGFATIYFPKPTNPNKEFKKIVFVKYIPQLNIVIGTGKYVNDAVNELKKELLYEITQKRYGKNGYIWIHDINCNLLAHPFRTEYIGNNECNLTDIKGNHFIQKFRDIALKGGGFVKYYWQNPSTKRVEKKISFVVYYRPFGWIIGSGVYLGDLNKMVTERVKLIQKRINHILLTSFLILLAVIIIVSFISYYLSKKTDTLFKIYKDDLENRIEKAVSESIKKDKMLQEQAKLASMGEMIGAIAHQWRQPLNALALNIQTLIDMAEDKDCEVEKIEKFVDKNMKTIKFMSDTIDNFRNFFRDDSQTEKLDIKDVVCEVLYLINAQLKNHNIDIEVKGDSFVVEGYRNRLAQVILNLINNAKDSILENKNSGKITITLDKSSKTLSVRDDGRPIDERIRDRIFEPYFTTKDTGTGIGLYMSREILKRMKANIYLKDNKTFVIDFAEGQSYKYI
jgi:signal transduction histidine kinase